MSDDILLEALDARWRRLRDEWERTRKKNSEDAVHDLRVASRRLLAVLDTLDSLVDDSGIEDNRRRVKKLLQALSPLRDVQVQAAYVSRMVPIYPQLADFKANLDKKEQCAAKKLRKLLKEPLGLGHAIARSKRHTKGQPLETPAIVGIVDKRYREVLELAEHVDRSNITTIHEVRLSFKRFRYTAELVQPLIRKTLTASRLKQFHSFQTMMGDIQDMEVLSSRLVKWAGKDEQRAAGLEPVLEELAQHKEKRIDTFMDSLHTVRSFWKL